MAADSWFKHKVMRTGRGQEGGSGKGWTEDAPDQQGFKATGKHRQHQTHRQLALSSTLPWALDIYLSWRGCILAQMSSLSCCAAVLLLITCQTSGPSPHISHFRKLPLAVLPQQPHHRVMAAVPQDSSPRLCLHKQVIIGLVLTENFTQFGWGFFFHFHYNFYLAVGESATCASVHCVRSIPGLKDHP